MLYTLHKVSSLVIRSVLYLSSMSDTSIFNFKKFKLIQSNTVFKITTDSLLLGAWAQVQERSRLIELGTGTGVVSLMLAQRFKDILIYGIDSQRAAYELCNRNFQNSPWSDRLDIDWMEYEDLLQRPITKYDDIISNPPYYNTTNAPTSSLKAMAKHQGLLNPKSIISAADTLLQPKGQIHIVVPSYREVEIVACAQEYGYYTIHIMRLKPKPHYNPVRSFLTFSKDIDMPSQTKVNTLIMYQSNGIYHPSYQDLLGSFLTVL